MDASQRLLSCAGGCADSTPCTVWMCVDSIYCLTCSPLLLCSCCSRNCAASTSKKASPICWCLATHTTWYNCQVPQSAHHSTLCKEWMLSYSMQAACQMLSTIATLR